MTNIKCALNIQSMPQWANETTIMLKGVKGAHIQGSQHGSSRILIRVVPACITMVTVFFSFFLLRCTFFKCFKGAFTHSRIATRTILGHHSGIISVLFPASQCIHRAGIRRDPWHTSISVITNQTCASFRPGVHRWKMIGTTPGRHRVPSV